MGKVKVPIGMQTSWFFPIVNEPKGKTPVYGPKLDMGAAVKGYLTVSTANASIPGDDITQIDIEVFTGGQLDAETTLSDLEINAKIYGHTYSEEGGEVSSSDDTAPNGGYAFVEPIMKSDKTIVYRATCLQKVSAMPSSEKQQADTKKQGAITPKNNMVSYKVMEAADRVWRNRNDFDSLDKAHAYIETKFPQQTV